VKRAGARHSAKDKFALTAEACMAAWRGLHKILMLNLRPIPPARTCNPRKRSIAKFAVEKKKI